MKPPFPRYGRRWVHVICMAITTLAFAIIVCLTGEDDDNDTAVVVMSIVSKLASNVGWFIMWVQCIEVFPTPLRGSGKVLQHIQ